MKATGVVVVAALAVAAVVVIWVMAPDLLRAALEATTEDAEEVVVTVNLALMVT